VTDETDGLAGSAPPVGWLPRAGEPSALAALAGASILDTPSSSAASQSPLVGASPRGNVAPPAAAAPSLLTSATDKFLVGRESGGKFDATNPTSSAYGLGQFTPDTAKTVAARHPELPPLGDFYSGDPKVAVPAQQAYIHAHALDQAKVLTEAGIAPTPQNIHMNWFLGESGGPRFLKAMQANPNVAGIALAQPDQVAANRGVFFKPDGTPRTASEVYGAINGGRAAPQGATPVAEASPAPAAPTAPPQPGETFRDEMKLKLLQGMFPQHAITPVEYDPWKLVPKVSTAKVDVNQGVS